MNGQVRNIYIYIYLYIYIFIFVCLLPTRSEEREILSVRSIVLATLLTCQDIKIWHYNGINMDLVGW